jgi:serine phosphatase RsbU (regulator of sigma subunit)
MPGSYYILLIGLEQKNEVLALSHFSDLGHHVVKASSLVEAEHTLGDPKLDLAYLQPQSGSPGTEELKHIQETRPGLPVILICGQSSASNTLNAWHSGAADAIFMPLNADSLNTSLKRVSPRIAPKESGSSQARIRYLDETGEERWTSIVSPRLTIGRSSNNDLILPQMNISRSQAEIVVQKGDYILRDLGSKHGTYVGGVRIEETKLTHGDRIQLGGLQGQLLTFYQGDLLQSLLASSDSKPEASLSVRGFREMGLLLETFRALSSIPLLDDLLSVVVDTAIELTGAERGFIMLTEKGELLFRCARDSYKRPLEKSFLQTSRRVPEEVFKTGKRMVINNLEGDDNPSDHSSTRRLGVRSIFCVPLRYLTFHDTGNLSGAGSMETIGVLYVDSQSMSTGLSSTQVDGLETLASEAAMAIYNARLYKEAQEKRKIEEELAIAREIQQALLPEPNKTLDFVCAQSQNICCQEVGGDYFDYFDFSDGSLGFVLGDVAGKGTPAALLTSMIQGIFSAQTSLSIPIPDMLSNVNRYLVKRGTGNRFVTLFFGILDPEGNCTYTNAGHCPPIVLGQDGSIHELTEGGMVLGLFADAKYESGYVKLKPGDHLILFTDGVIEAWDTRGEEFGVKRLRALLKENATASSAEILARLRDAIFSFSIGAAQHDDITMMILGYQEATASASEIRSHESGVGI